MKKTIILALALALLGGAAYANWGARDTVPAATLLVPYIVVDMTGTGANAVPNPSGYTTLTVVTNVSSAAQIIHVSVYNAASQGVVDFDEVLSGYDVWQINWRDLLTGDFELFDTGNSANPPGAETPGGKLGFWNATDVSPYSAIVSDTAPAPWGPSVNTKKTFTGLDAPWDIDSVNSTGCGYPWKNQATFAGLIVSGLQAPLISWPNQDTDCALGAEIKGWGGWLSGLGQQPLFFYALIDSVNACSGQFPDSNLFWTGAPPNPIPGNTSYLTNNNTLTGYDIYMNNTQNYSESLPTVNLEGASGYSGVGFYTSLRNYAKITAADTYTAREPLPTAWAFNFMNNSGITTEVGVWKNYTDFEFDSKGNPLYIMAARPYIYYAFDQSENSLASTSPNCPSGTFCLQPEPNVFPFQTQKVAVTPANFDGLPTTAAGNFGWMLLVFEPSIGGQFTTQNACSFANGTHSVYNSNAIDFQSYVFAKYNYGTYSTSVEATAMSSPNVTTGAQSQLPALNTSGLPTVAQ